MLIVDIDYGSGKRTIGSFVRDVAYGAHENFVPEIPKCKSNAGSVMDWLFLSGVLRHMMNILVVRIQVLMVYNIRFTFVQI